MRRTPAFLTTAALLCLAAMASGVGANTGVLAIMRTAGLLARDSERFLGVEWSEEPTRAFETGVLVTVANGKGVLARVSAAVAAAEADITHVDMGREPAQSTTDLVFAIAVRDRNFSFTLFAIGALGDRGGAGGCLLPGRGNCRPPRQPAGGPSLRPRRHPAPAFRRRLHLAFPRRPLLAREPGPAGSRHADPPVLPVRGAVRLPMLMPLLVRLTVSQIHAEYRGVSKASDGIQRT